MKIPEILSNKDFQIENALYIIPTPIGNLSDITFRTLQVLQSLDIVACEDTRTTGKLLKMLDIDSPRLISYHNYNEEERAEQIANEIKSGKSVGLVSDAGTPLISDPGYRLIQAVINNDIKIIPLPGATAFVPALTVSGLPAGQFIFVGFPPQKKGRKTFIENVSNMSYTSVFYESPHRIVKLIDELILFCGEDRKVCVSREISKIYEEHIRGTLIEVKIEIEKKASIKGEFVLILQGINKKN